MRKNLNDNKALRNHRGGLERERYAAFRPFDIQVSKIEITSPDYPHPPNGDGDCERYRRNSEDSCDTYH